MTEPGHGGRTPLWGGGPGSPPLPLRPIGMGTYGRSHGRGRRSCCSGLSPVALGHHVQWAMGELPSPCACVPRERAANPDAASEGPARRPSLSLGTVCRGSFLEQSLVLWAVGAGAFLEVGMGEGSVLQQGGCLALGVGAPCTGAGGGGEGHAPARPPPHPVQSSPKPQGQGRAAPCASRPRAASGGLHERAERGCWGWRRGTTDRAGCLAAGAVGAGSPEATRSAWGLVATQEQSRLLVLLVGTSRY